MTDIMKKLTKAQLRDLPSAIKEAQVYVDSDIQEDLNAVYWNVILDDETRPGRGHRMKAIWTDYIQYVEISMDVYGYPSVYVSELSPIHYSYDEECPCVPCTVAREEEDDE